MLSELPCYLKDIDFLCTTAGLDEAQKIKAALCYAILDEVEIWEMLAEANAAPVDWDKFIDAVKKMYPGCEGTNQYCCADLQYLVQDYHGKVLHSQDELGEYTQTFYKVSAILIADWKLADMEWDVLYLIGFHLIWPDFWPYVAQTWASFQVDHASKDKSRHPVFDGVHIPPWRRLDPCAAMVSEEILSSKLQQVKKERASMSCNALIPAQSTLSSA